MTPAILAGLLEHGLLGLLVAAASVVIVALYRARDADRAANAAALERVRDAHLAEAREYQRQLLELTKASVIAVTQGTHAAEAVKESVLEVRELFEEHTDLLRRAVHGVHDDDASRGREPRRR